MKKLISKWQNNEVIQSFLIHYKNSDMDLSSIAVAYYMMLTVFPFLVLLANIFPYFNIDTSSLLEFLKDYLPTQLYDSVATIIKSIFERPSSGLVWLSLLAAFWTISKSLVFLQKAMNKAYDMQDHRDFIVSRLVGIFSSLVLIIFLIMAVIISTFGSSLLALLYQQLQFGQNLYQLLDSLIQPITGLLSFVTLAFLYYILPNVRIQKIRYVIPGTVFTSIVFVFFTNLVGNYIGNTIQNMENLRILGSVTLFAIMFWFIFFSKILIIGGIINAIYQKQHVKTFEARRGTILSFFESLFSKNKK
ncbi:YhjD/YihY/BrkB family envelope integrity protein [Streptococcus zalophi]|uniref:YihY/virulence factor BrkB family protein n=1 Tax=Streptococcus zalophi TaxID=640031 RepID=A0A934PA34_9STRE|nr:YihY/virulence factor BrkB family protein [Streptococcus zalophi]